MPLVGQVGKANVAGKLAADDAGFGVGGVVDGKLRLGIGGTRDARY